jgi:hypothetical protein
MKFSVIYLLFFLALVSCSRPTTFTGKIVYSELENCKDTLSLQLNKKNVSLVSLENPRKYLIGNIQKVVLTSQYFFILSENSVYQFTRSGKFVRLIGNTGLGPKEFVKIQDIAVNEKEEKVYLSDSQKMIKFNFKGEFCSIIPSDILWKFEVTDNDRLIINPMNILGDEPYKLLIKDQLGETIDRFSNSIIFEPQALCLYPQLKSIFRLENDFIFHQQFSDTVFTINPKEYALTYRYSVDFNGDRITNEAIGNGEKEIDSSIYINDITEDMKYIYLTCSNRGNNLRYVIEKTTGKYYIPDFYIKSKKIGFWPEWQYQDSLLVSIVDTSYPLLAIVNSNRI